MTNKEKLTEATMLALQGKLEEGKDRITEIVNIILDEDYDGAYDAVGGAYGTIYSYIKDLFTPDSGACLEDLDRFSDIDLNNKSTLKSIALGLIKDVCYNEEWSVSEAKEDCGYYNL